MIAEVQISISTNSASKTGVFPTLIADRRRLYAEYRKVKVTANDSEVAELA